MVARYGTGLAYGIMGQIARLRYSLPFPASAAFQAGQISIGLRSAYTGCVGEPLGAHAACLAHGVVRLVAGLSPVLILAADGAIRAREVGAAVRAAHAKPILLSDLTGAAGLAADIDGIAAGVELKVMVGAPGARLRGEMRRGAGWRCGRL